MVKALCFQCRGCRFDPWLEHEDPQASRLKIQSINIRSNIILASANNRNKFNKDFLNDSHQKKIFRKRMKL